eukprot:TRINITY_DN16678_c0_g1_i2.p1 TRINITY_DN16678_c0_g1~~TRINITY_DN16678_c0_g1_i2.p1  ORF type:complete len:288 (-),score=51.23 TRINITY_DN16678_c0_g1_i2:65-928(-)
MKEPESGNLINANQVADKYDPSFPNDYEEACKQRKARKQSQERRKRRDEDEARESNGKGDRGYEHRAEPTPPTNMDLNVSGDEAYRRRMQMSGMAPPAAASAAEFAQDEESFAQKMMRQQGWKPGEGLGSQGQGITSALEHKKTGRTSGSIIQSAPVAGLAPQQAPTGVPAVAPVPKKKKVKGRPSKVVLLRNMVGPGDVDDDLQGEVAEECTKYGEVDAVRVLEDGNLAAEKAVRIFIRFFRQESAMKALVDLNGRFFGGRTVDVIFFSEQRFNDDDLSPGNDDFE